MRNTWLPSALLLATIASAGGELVPARHFYPAEPGEYTLTFRFGNETAPTRSWVKVEGQRVVIGEVRTKPGEFKEVSTTVSVRDRRLPTGGHVAPINEDGGRMLWDDRLHVDVFTEGAKAPEPKVEKAKREEIVKVFVAGDSTVCDTNEGLWQSWGGTLPLMFGPRASVANYAQSGGTLQSFVRSGRFAKMLAEARKGDLLLIQYMHNDSGERGPEAGAFNGYYHRLRRIVESCRAKGMKVAILSAMERCRFDQKGRIVPSHGDYPAAAEAVARATGAAYIDLGKRSAELFESQGADGCRRLFRMAKAGEYPWFPDARFDSTHFKDLGAYALARIVATELARVYPETKPLMRACYAQAFDPRQPDLGVEIPPTTDAADLFGSTRGRVGFWGADITGDGRLASEPAKAIEQNMAWDRALDFLAMTVCLAPSSGEAVVAGAGNYTLKEALGKVPKGGCNPPRVVVKCEPGEADAIAARVKALGESDRVFVLGSKGCPYVWCEGIPSAKDLRELKGRGMRVLCFDNRANYENTEGDFLAGVHAFFTDNEHYPEFREYDPKRAIR